MRTIRRFTANPQVKAQLLAWGKSFRECVWLDSNDFDQRHSSFDAVLAVDAFTSVRTDWHQAFDNLKEYVGQTGDWLFGYLSYDLKNDIEDLSSANLDGLQFPELFFFQPKKLFLLKDDTVQIQYLHFCHDEIDDDWREIRATNHVESVNSVAVRQRISNAEYLQKVGIMVDHILRGDIYEANFCMEFYANAAIDPLSVYNRLNRISTPPFACFLRRDRQFLLSASPERYLRKQSDTVLSQPIKGTAKRSDDNRTDQQIKSQLLSSEKERSENIMITDLVRNDLSKTALRGSVEVEELCGAYSFRQVHHLISTIVSKVDPKTNPVDIIKTTFPMGSMTGAPKISAMQIIEKLEETKRGLYSGAVGYFTPDGDFDFNVVIRSILYDDQKKYVSFSVGSAITAQSDPQSEYEECMLKARAMFEVLGDKKSPEANTSGPGH